MALFSGKLSRPEEKRLHGAGLAACTLPGASTNRNGQHMGEAAHGAGPGWLSELQVNETASWAGNPPSLVVLQDTEGGHGYLLQTRGGGGPDGCAVTLHPLQRGLTGPVYSAGG